MHYAIQWESNTWFSHYLLFTGCSCIIELKLIYLLVLACSAMETGHGSNPLFFTFNAAIFRSISSWMASVAHGRIITPTRDPLLLKWDIHLGTSAAEFCGSMRMQGARVRATATVKQQDEEKPKMKPKTRFSEWNSLVHCIVIVIRRCRRGCLCLIML